MPGKEENKKSGMRKSLLCVTLIPTILFGIVIIVYCSNQLTSSIHQEVESSLKNIARSAEYMCEREYPGEYRLEQGTSVVYKGDKRVESASDIFESLKEITGAEITIFYKDVRIVTTIRDRENSPIVGTRANSVIVKDVLEGKEEHFYTETRINDENYFSYYCPLYDSQGSCIGMVFAGKPSQYVRRIVWEGILPIISIIFLLSGVIVLIMCRYSEQLTRSMQKLQSFLLKVEDGNFTAELSGSVAERKDELGRIGRSAIQMQTSLRELVERDSLTGLYNRHYGEVWLREIKKDSEVTGVSYYVAIADIDHFKRFNDQYGHDCGDLVLRRVSQVLREYVSRRGCAARWGGEEFLLVFIEKNHEIAVSMMNRMVEEISRLKIRYGEEELGVTVTVGMVKGTNGCGVHELIKAADQALYEGKESGRNKVVCCENV